MTYAETAALLVSLVAAMFTALQWASARRSAESSERSAGAAERSAQAAEGSAQTSLQFARTGQRAWITVTKIEPMDRDASQVPHSVKVHFKNSGKTPAYKVFVRGTLYNASTLDSISSFEGLYMLDATLPLSRAPLGAGEIGDDWNKVEFTDITVWKQIADGNVKLYCIGELLYSDIFGDDHTVRWCYFYVPVTQMFFPYSRFNAVD